ncbi:PAS domain-containing hybrid sensor histidine kinase/response regulator [Ideonella sp.]|uniref:PAS domain-containing hybrid sensor histidine kinase/response regulator n=1 Tax=Ideonella sp. TaxID=1929293 RepID=UPI002B48D8E7|nr:ATP-binding protein [Ideonella sp.]HJV71987.1 ATP-binding protein [Ideonella sp.]
MTPPPSASGRPPRDPALPSTEENVRLLVDSVTDYAIFMLDTEGRVISWNAGAQRIKGYRPEEIIGKHFERFYPEDKVAAGWPREELRRALAEGRLQDEGWRIRNDGSRFWAGVVITPVFDHTGVHRGFAKVTRDMSDQRRLIELEQAAQRMNEFIAMLAHELRNPLAPICNAVSVLRMQPDLPPVVRKMGDMVDRQARQLTRLVDDLLDVGRIATGKMSLQREHLDYRELLLASIEAVRPLMVAKRHRLEIEVARAIPMHGDPTRLSQVLHNLLSNAARYTPDGGRITISVVVDGTRCVTRVCDNGQGIAPDALERIFGLFEQEAGVARDPSERSLGIGLTLARTMAELHGGSLTAHSEGRGRGARFELVLPCEAPVSATVVGAAGPAVQANRLRALVVDDNRDSADSMVMLLGQLGHEAHAAYAAEPALRSATATDPTLVLLDLNMPQQDGFEVIRRLRSTVHHPLYVAAMTGYGQRSDRERTRGAGFDEHLTKPVSLDQLLRVIERASALIRH